MEYEWYVDVFFLTNFFMDTAGIFAAAICCSQPVKLLRMLVVCAGSVILSILLFVFSPGYLFYSLLVHTVLNPAMTALIFKPERWGLFFRLLLTVYVLFFFMGGVQESVLLTTGNGNLRLTVSGIFAAAAFLIYLQRQKTMRYVCTVDLWLQEKKVTVSAYCDSGNLLRNPKNGKPVSILEEKIIGQWDTEALKTERIPYHTIGEAQAYLKVITLDKMEIYRKGTTRRIKAPEIGLHEGQLIKHPPVQMLLHGSYMS